MEPDPIGLEGGLNPYAYAGSNPVMNSDSSGLALDMMTNNELSMVSGINNSLNNIILNQQINSLNNSLNNGSPTLSKLSDNEMGNISGGVAPIFYFIAVAGGFVLTVDGLVDGDPPQAKGAKVADKAIDFYRGAKAADIPHFNPRTTEFKIDANGFVKNGSDAHARGVSLFNNPTSLTSKGFTPYKVNPNSLPNGLGIFQRGADPKHYEILPTPGTFLTPE